MKSAKENIGSKLTILIGEPKQTRQNKLGKKKHDALRTRTQSHPPTHKGEDLAKT